MDRADTCRRAAREAIADVEPPQLHERIVETIETASMAPGVLTLASAAAIDADATLERLTHHAAGVQLIYEGLRLTRTLAHTEPWTTGEPEQGDLEILAADILVARGFYLLARTEAAETAVRTVRHFGRDQTLRDQPGADVDSLDSNLERDVLELAVRAGAAAVGTTPTSALLSVATDVAEKTGASFPPARECLPTLAAQETDHTTAVGDGVATSAGDP